MKGRCNNPSYDAYRLYGGRGIRVCEEWNGKHSFETFQKWAIDSGYKDSLTIDRINVDGDYTPYNCRWATAKEQGINRRTTIFIKYRGEERTLTDWCNKLGLCRTVIRKKMKKNPFITPDELFEMR